MPGDVRIYHRIQITSPGIEITYHGIGSNCSETYPRTHTEQDCDEYGSQSRHRKDGLLKTAAMTSYPLRGEPRQSSLYTMKANKSQKSIQCTKINNLRYTNANDFICAWDQALFTVTF